MSADTWDGSERRHPLPHKRLGDEPSNSDLMDLIVEVRQELRSHISEEQPFFKVAFIDNDVQRHRDEHSALAAIIANQKAQEEFWNTMMRRAAETGLIGLLKIIGWLIFIGIATVIGLKYDWIGPRP